MPQRLRNYSRGQKHRRGQELKKDRRGQERGSSGAKSWHGHRSAMEAGCSLPALDVTGEARLTGAFNAIERLQTRRAEKEYLRGRAIDVALGTFAQADPRGMHGA